MKHDTVSYKTCCHFKCSVSRCLTLAKGCHLIFAKTPGYVISWLSMCMQGGEGWGERKRGQASLCVHFAISKMIFLSQCSLPTSMQSINIHVHMHMSWLQKHTHTNLHKDRCKVQSVPLSNHDTRPEIKHSSWFRVRESVLLRVCVRACVCHPCTQSNLISY